MKTYFIAIACVFLASLASATERWTQLQGDSRRSGNAPQVDLPEKLGLVAAVPLTDGIYTSPAIADGMVYVIDGSGVVFAINA